MSRRFSAARFVFVLLVLLGILGVTAGIALVYQSLSLVAQGTKAEGIVIRNVWSKPRKGSVHPVIQFQANGNTVEFAGAVSTSRPAYAVNNRVTIYYLPENPQKAIIDSFSEKYFLAVVIGGFGAVFLSVGGGCLWVPAWLARQRQGIIDAGVPVQATILDIQVDRSLKVNNRSPWVVVAQFKDDLTDQMITCKSHYLWEDPKLHYRVGDPVTVYHLQDRPEKCAFDLDKIAGSS